MCPYRLAPSPGPGALAATRTYGLDPHPIFAEPERVATVAPEVEAVDDEARSLATAAHRLAADDHAGRGAVVQEGASVLGQRDHLPLGPVDAAQGIAAEPASRSRASLTSRPLLTPPDRAQS